MFAFMLIVLILIAFRNQKMKYAGKGSEKEMVCCLLWLLLYFILASISCASAMDIINEMTNWLFLVLFPLLLISSVRKENIKICLQEIGLKRMDVRTGIRILLVCMIYAGVIFFVFISGNETTVSLTSIFKMLAEFPLYFGLMLLTAAFTEEFFFRGILQRCIENSIRQPYIAILLVSILFGLYHFPFAFYLWEGTAGSILDSLKAVLAEQAVCGCALGLIYDKCNRNLWGSIFLHAFSNALIMSFGVAFTASPI